MTGDLRMRPGGFKCCWYEDSNIAWQCGALAEGVYAFLTAQLANQGRHPYLAAPLWRGHSRVGAAFKERLLRRAGLAFSSGQTLACEKAVHKLCTAWAQHIGVPARFPSTTP